MENRKIFMVKVYPCQMLKKWNPRLESELIAIYDNEPSARRRQNEIKQILEITNKTNATTGNWLCSVEQKVIQPFENWK